MVGFDIDRRKIEKYRREIDVTNNVRSKVLKKTTEIFTWDETMLATCSFHIVAVPTPVNRNNTPDLSPLLSACKILGRNLRKGSIVVFESTVFPGATEEICVPVLEKASGFKYGIDFKVGYSPERINPGDKLHRLDNVIKIVSATDEEALDFIAKTYELVVTAGIYKVSSIKVAEAAKVIENTQRDVNIAFINEISILLNRLGIDTYEVIQAAETKWNFQKFFPGLVGGHCISVDPYYLISKAFEVGYNPDVILSARKVNNSMGEYIAMSIVKLLIQAGKKPLSSKVLIFGIAFKENVSDIRNSGVLSIINELRNLGIKVAVSDPHADKKLVKSAFGIDLCFEDQVKNADAVVVAVAHDIYKCLDFEQLKTKFLKAPYILIDLKKLFDKKEAEDKGFIYFSL